jgi:hypothetical protein
LIATEVDEVIPVVHLFAGTAKAISTSPHVVMTQKYPLTGSSVVDGVVRLEVHQLLRLGTDEHVAHKQRMVSTSAHDTNVDSVALIPAGKTVDNVDAISCVEVIHGTFSVNAPNLCNVIST